LGRRLRSIPLLAVALFGAFLLGVYWWFYELDYGIFSIPVRSLPWYAQLINLGIPILLYLILLAIVLSETKPYGGSIQP